MQTILLTGGTGYIGSHVAVELLQNSYNIIIVDNLANSYSTVISAVEQITSKKIKFYQCDINNYNHLDQVFQENTIDVVIHLAGHKAVTESVNDPLKYYDNNVGGLITLLKCMKTHQVKKIIFSSSASVYGNPQSLPITEDNEINILNPYGSSKLISENILRDIPGLSVIILRYFNPVGNHNLLGENPKKDYKNLFPIIMTIYGGQKECLEIFGYDFPTEDGTAIRDYIHVIDLAQGHVKSLDYILQNNIKYELFNLGTGRGYSVLDIVRGFEKHSGQKLPFLLKDKRKGEPTAVYADCRKANDLLGWKAKYTLDDMIKSTLNGFKETRSSCFLQNNYKTTFVTAFYLVKDYNNPGKSVEKYFEHFDILAKTGIPIAIYINPQFEERVKKYGNVKVLELLDVKDTWTYQQVDVNNIGIAANRNPLKDSMEYMITINSKIECVHKTIQANPFNTEQFAWIDFGIFHVIKDIDKSYLMLQNIANNNFVQEGVIIPGCWQLSQKYDYVNQINWTFCGGFFLGHKDQLINMWQQYQKFFPQFLKQYNTMVWEVNIWSAMVHENNWRPLWYKADHNDSIIVIPKNYFT